MLLCSNNSFGFLAITLPAPCLLTVLLNSLYEVNNHAKKALSFHSSQFVLSRFKNINNTCKDSLIKYDSLVETHTEKYPVFKVREVDKTICPGQRININGKSRQHKQEEI